MALTDNLLAFYKLSDTSDSSGNNRTLTNNGNVSFASGKIGNAAVFDGQSYLTIDSQAQLGSNLSVSFWINPYNISQYTGCISIDNYFDGFLFRIGEGTGQIWVFNTDAQNGTSQYFTVNEWNHVSVVVSNGICKTYVNNALVDTFSYDSQASFGNAPKITLGASNHALYQDPLNGSMDAVGIWNRALSDAEVAELYNSGTGLELDGVAQPTLVKMQAPVKFFGKVKFVV